MEHFTVFFYDRPDGTEPVCEFLQSLDKKMLAKVVREIELLSVNGPGLREPYSKSLGDGIFELRTKVSTDITRVLYFFVVGRKNYSHQRFCEKDRQDAKVRD